MQKHFSENFFALRKTQSKDKPGLIHSALHSTMRKAFKHANAQDRNYVAVRFHRQRRKKERRQEMYINEIRNGM